MASLLLSLSFLVLVPQPNYLDDIVSIKLFKASSHDDFLMVLFSEEEAGLLQALTVECIGVFEDLAHRFSLDVLGKDYLALLLDGAYVKAVSQRKEIVDELGVHLDLVGVEVPEEHQEQVVVVVGVFSLTLLFLSKVHREGLLKNIRSTRQDYLMAVDGLTFNDQSDVTEFCYVQ